MPFLFYDFESTGAHTAYHQAVQAAMVQTDDQLNATSEEVLFCKLRHDIIPDPQAMLVHGLDTTLLLKEGLNEYDFVQRILRQMTAEPRTRITGYNNLKFDDELLRHTLYRNLLPTYNHEWENGNSRSDIYRLMLMAYAFSREGIRWPLKEDGVRPDLRLEALAKANGVAGGRPHDALNDVYDTLALARLVRDADPAFFNYFLSLSNKRDVIGSLALGRPVLMASPFFAPEHRYLSVVLPLAKHPVNGNEFLCVDLGRDPAPLFDLDADQLRRLMFSKRADLEDDAPQVPLVSVQANKLPLIIQLSPAVEASYRDSLIRSGIDLETAKSRQSALMGKPDIRHKLIEVHRGDLPPVKDVDGQLYSGGFFSRDDSRRVANLHGQSPERWEALAAQCLDPRIAELALRIKARNFPKTLSGPERSAWMACLQDRYTNPENEVGLTFDQYRVQRDALRAGGLSAEQSARLDALDNYLGWLEAKFNKATQPVSTGPRRETRRDCEPGLA